MVGSASPGKQEQDRKAEASRALKRGCFAFSTAWSFCAIINTQHYCLYPSLLLLLSLRLKTLGASVQFNSKMFSPICFPELLRLQIRCLYFKYRITVLPSLKNASVFSSAKLQNTGERQMRGIVTETQCSKGKNITCTKKITPQTLKLDRELGAKSVPALWDWDSLTYYIFYFRKLSKEIFAPSMRKAEKACMSSHLLTF